MTKYRQLDWSLIVVIGFQDLIGIFFKDFKRKKVTSIMADNLLKLFDLN